MCYNINKINYPHYLRREMGGTPSWDLFIMLGFVALVAYGFLLQRDRAVVTMISIYVALIITAVLVGPAQDFFSGEKALFNQVFIRGNTNAFTIQAGIFLVTVALLSTKSGIEGHGSSSSVFEMFGFSVLNAALIISTILLYMDPAKRDTVMQASKLARMLIQYHTWILVLPAIFLVFTGWNKSHN